MKEFDVARLAFRLSAAFWIFLLGGVFATRELQPYQIFEDGYRAARTLVQERLQTRPTLLSERRYRGDGVTRHDPARAHRGLTLMEGWFAEGPELRLVDMAGHVVHRWRADLFRIWPDPVHVFPEENIPAGPFNFHTQGMWLSPDGSVVVNFAEIGTVKMDHCGRVQWKIDRMTHHSVTANPDGSFWIPAKGDVRKVPDDLLLPGVSEEELMESQGWYEDRLLLVGADGTIKKEISVLQALFEGGFEHGLFDVSLISASDPTHVNGIEVVTPALARKIAGVRAGDLLISIRQMHMLAILDRDTRRIKWHHIGPWVRQHDPDITAQGTIEVFDNGALELSLGRVPGSRLISLDPATGRTSTIYPRRSQDSFHTEIMGTHQLLANGNRLITESLAGRVFEVDRQGNIVWEYVKPYDDSHAALIESAIRYDQNYLKIRDWRCP
ncbi:MAG: arylsulfotransferase family protein [Geminicoccaceae bacterium]